MQLGVVKRESSPHNRWQCHVEVVFSRELNFILKFRVLKKSSSVLLSSSYRFTALLKLEVSGRCCLGCWFRASSFEISALTFVVLYK
jgi:hypothetical protein